MRDCTPTSSPLFLFFLSLPAACLCRPHFHTSRRSVSVLTLRVLHLRLARLVNCGLVIQRPDWALLRIPSTVPSTARTYLPSISPPVQDWILYTAALALVPTRDTPSFACSVDFQDHGGPTGTSGLLSLNSQLLGRGTTTALGCKTCIGPNFSSHRQVDLVFIRTRILSHAGLEVAPKHRKRQHASATWQRRYRRSP